MGSMCWLQSSKSHLRNSAGSRVFSDFFWGMAVATNGIVRGLGT